MPQHTNGPGDDDFAVGAWDERVVETANCHRVEVIARSEETWRIGLEPRVFRLVARLSRGPCRLNRDTIQELRGLGLPIIADLDSRGLLIARFEAGSRVSELW